MRANYIVRKEDLFKRKFDDIKKPFLSYFEKSVAEDCADKTIAVLKCTTETGYVFKKGKNIRSLELDFVETEEKEKKGIDKRRTPKTV